MEKAMDTLLQLDVHIPDAPRLEWGAPSVDAAVAMSKMPVVPPQV